MKDELRVGTRVVLDKDGDQATVQIERIESDQYVARILHSKGKDEQVSSLKGKLVSFEQKHVQHHS